MSATWIKLNDALHEDPRVFAMAEAIAATAQAYILAAPTRDLFGPVTDTVTRNALRDVTIAGLSRVWRAANRHTTDGIFRHAHPAYLDTLAQIPGFGPAMIAVGWATHDPEARTITLPNFDQHNAPDKNGERAKTAAARRQQRLRDRKKAAAETLSDEPPSTTVNNGQPPSPPRDNVTSRHAESNATPSISSSLSLSITESKTSDSETTVNNSQPGQPPSTAPAPLTLDQHKARIDTLRPAWKKMPAWSHEDDAALYNALPNLHALEDKDWLMLVNYMKWANSTANQGKDAHKVTSRRHAFLESLPSYLDRATAHWKQSGAPKLGTVSPSPGLPVPKSAPSPEPIGPTDAFLQLAKDMGIPRRPPPSATQKPAAA